MSVTEWNQALRDWAPSPTRHADQVRALEEAWRRITVDFELDLPSVNITVVELPPRARVRVANGALQIAGHVVRESWAAALAALLYAAVLLAVGGERDRGRGVTFCVEANRIGSMIGAIPVRPRAHGYASPALWPTQAANRVAVADVQMTYK